MKSLGGSRPSHTLVEFVFHFANMRRQEPIWVWGNHPALHHPRDPTVRVVPCFIVVNVKDAVGPRGCGRDIAEDINHSVLPVVAQT
jgi:hypothetical protein